MMETERNTAGWKTWNEARLSANNRQQWRNDVADLCDFWRRGKDVFKHLSLSVVWHLAPVIPNIWKISILKKTFDQSNLNDAIDLDLDPRSTKVKGQILSLKWKWVNLCSYLINNIFDRQTSYLVPRYKSLMHIHWPKWRFSNFTKMETTIGYISDAI